MDIDSDGKRLFVAALGSDPVEVVDLQAGKRVSRIEHLREPQRLAYPAPAHRLFVANRFASGDVQMFNEGNPPVAASAKKLDDAYWPFRGCVNESACSFSERPSVQTAP